MRSRAKSKLRIVFIVLLLAMVSAYILFREGTLPVDKNSRESQIFVIKPGEGLNAIINNLNEHRLIRNRIVFFAIVYQTGIDKKIQAGDFDLSAVDFAQQAPEGRLFPDTYLIPKDATIDTIVAIFTNNFESKFAPLEEKRKKIGLTEDQTVTLASLVEREAKFDKDRQPIASILLRRMRNGMRLQIDATVQYALGYDSAQKRWWRELSIEELKTPSPYNTYVNDGLPPGPISNPGFASLEAVVNADESTPYLFYIHDKSGRTHYARNGDEHERNIQRYLR